MPRNSYHDTPVVEFHEAFGALVAWRPAVPPPDRIALRLKLIFEEACELAEACGYETTSIQNAVGSLLDHGPYRRGEDQIDLVAAADALTDIRYVTDGACLEFGLPAEKLLREVHRSNMSKLGEDGRPILREDGKILKGPNYTPPDLKTIIALYSEINNHG